ncbi:unnamed protein product [Cyclocybe aegerita]|uniref:Heme haloperoxidase family profile domain-containing protein n=1 Tax=Cyclocybe aegerita TaxID=1973307 RepID=A0A8S0W1B3_CYCAE|nr:unnamed protein product [Cyclocybe aegerita]
MPPQTRQRAKTNLWICRARNGLNLKFFEVVRAIVFVYNISYPLAILLASVGFLASGKITFKKDFISKAVINSTSCHWTDRIVVSILNAMNFVLSFVPTLTLDLGDLSQRGTSKLAHEASFVHPNGIPSTAPDANMVNTLLDYSSSRRNYQGFLRFGLGLVDVARFHAERVRLSPPLNKIHNQIALGECALAWDVLRDHRCSHGAIDFERIAHLQKGKYEGIVPTSRLEAWFGQERLPDGWWDVCGVRPTRTIGIARARGLANLIGKLAMKQNGVQRNAKRNTFFCIPPDFLVYFDAIGK